MLTPERSIQIQRSIGADIMMQVLHRESIFNACHERPTYICSWMMLLTLDMRTKTDLRKQDTGLWGGWTGEHPFGSLTMVLVAEVSLHCFTRCLSAHPRPDLQNLFPIVQGGLEEDKRKDCADQVGGSFNIPIPILFSWWNVMSPVLLLAAFLVEKPKSSSGGLFLSNLINNEVLILYEVIFLLKNGGSFCSIPPTNCTSLSDGSWTSGVLILNLFS